jgi:hypothetical protein
MMGIVAKMLPVHGVHDTYWINVFIIFIKIGKFLAIISSNTFPVL